MIIFWSCDRLVCCWMLHLFSISSFAEGGCCSFQISSCVHRTGPARGLHIPHVRGGYICLLSRESPPRAALLVSCCVSALFSIVFFTACLCCTTFYLIALPCLFICYAAGYVDLCVCDDPFSSCFVTLLPACFTAAPTSPFVTTRSTITV